MGQEVASLDDELQVDQIASALQAIAHSTRLKILCFLNDQEKTVSDILEHVGTTQSNISQHIEVLRKAGIVCSRRSHNQVFCYLENREMMPLIAQIKDLFCV